VGEDGGEHEHGHAVDHDHDYEQEHDDEWGDARLAEGAAGG